MSAPLSLWKTSLSGYLIAFLETRMTAKKNITCPTCGQKNTWTPENENRPFCSARCKLIDLGAWASEEHRIPGDPVNPTAEDPSDNHSED